MQLQVREPKANWRFEGHDLHELREMIDGQAIDRCLVSSTVKLSREIQADIDRLNIPSTRYLDHTTPLPVRNAYKTPDTLGSDRLAAAIGAYFTACAQAGAAVPVLVIDAGTAITYDFVTADGQYLGGNISPGVEMRFKALHHYTSRLPLVSESGEHPDIGHSTETAIRCGVIDGVRHEIQGFISRFCLKHPRLLVFLTGGDYLDFEESAKKRIFADRFLVHKGLDLILQGIDNS